MVTVDDILINLPYTVKADSYNIRMEVKDRKIKFRVKMKTIFTNR
jgi:hypothetical protein